MPAQLEPLPVTQRPYDQSFVRWVARNVAGGDKLALCMQCGMCSGSCRTAHLYDHGPRLVFQMIRAGMVHEVMTSSSIHGCGLCYLCVTRCPRKVPVAHILKDLGRKADQLGYSTRAVPPVEAPGKIPNDTSNDTSNVTQDTCPDCAASAASGPRT